MGQRFDVVVDISSETYKMSFDTEVEAKKRYEEIKSMLKNNHNDYVTLENGVRRDGTTFAKQDVRVLRILNLYIEKV